jgi:hypothetical protein
MRYSYNAAANEVTESFDVEEVPGSQNIVVKGKMMADSSQEDLVYIKNFINDLLSKWPMFRVIRLLTPLPAALGMGWKNSQFPWGNMAKDLAVLGLVMLNWDPLVPLPGDPARNRSKGISDLTKEQRSLLRGRCDHPTHPLRVKHMPSKRTGTTVVSQLLLWVLIIVL